MLILLKQLFEKLPSESIRTAIEGHYLDLHQAVRTALRAVCVVVNR